MPKRNQRIGNRAVAVLVYLALAWIYCYFWENTLFREFGWDFKVQLLGFGYFFGNSVLYLLCGVVYAVADGRLSLVASRRFALGFSLFMGFAFEAFLFWDDAPGARSSPAETVIGYVFTSVAWSLTELWMPWLATRSVMRRRYGESEEEARARYPRRLRKAARLERRAARLRARAAALSRRPWETSDSEPRGQ